MPTNSDDLLQLIDAIYGAAMNAAEWPAVLQRIADTFGAAEASLSAVSANEVPWLVAPRTDPEFLASYGAHYHPLNLFWQRMVRLPVGTAATNEMLLPAEVLQSSEFYNDWSRPQGYLAVMGATLLVGDGWRVEFVMPGKREFGPAHLKLNQAIAPHLTRAMQMTKRMANAEVSRAESASTLDQLSHGVIVVDAQARTMFVNRAAEATFLDGLKLQDGMLRTASVRETIDLHA